jgi:peptide/nickel transport system substrate-binding protein
VEANGATLDEQRFPGRQGRIVFAYLAAQKGRPVPRDELAELLWGEELPATWDKALRVLMTKLRALLEECGIDGSTALKSAFGCYKLSLPPGAWIDVDAAAEAAERAVTALAAGELGDARSQAEVATALARRSFLPGEDGPWVEERRRDLRDILVRALECLRDASFASGDFVEAARNGREVLQLEPFRESAYRRLMEAHAAAGNPAEALRVYEGCRRFLADELGAYPSPETEAIYVEILRSKRASAPKQPVTADERRRRKAIVLAVALVLAGAAVAGAFLLVREGGAGASLVEVDGNAVAALDASSGGIRHTVEAPVAPTALAAGYGYVWAASADSNTVVVLDPETNTVRDTIAVESAPGGIAVGGGWAWVTNSLTGSVSQISPETLSVVQTIRVGNGPTGIAFGRGHVWVTNTSDHTVSKLRASDGRPVETFAAGPDPGAVAIGEGAVWIASKLSATVLKLSPESGEVLDRIPVGEGPAAIGVGAGSVWVANTLSGTVSQIDPRSGQLRGTVAVGPSADGIAVTRRDVWAASALAGTVSRITGSGRDPIQVRTGGRPTALAPSEGTVYVGLRPSGAAHAGGTLRVVFSAGDPPEIDTATAYSPEAWRTLVLTNDGLVGWRRVGGQAGTELVPDLAVSLPSVSEDRRSYTFQLRAGVRYSDGRLVKASDVRYSLERLFKLKPRPQPAAVDFYRGIVGGDRCSRRPSRCDLSHGIVTDDRVGTVIFRLRAPDPEFSFKLAMPFAYVLPAGTGLHEAVRRPLPATGPYRIASTSPSGAVRLVRNSRFREWSSAAQPAGFADEILIRVHASAAERARLVAGGKADYTWGTGGEPLPISPAHRPRLHLAPVPATYYLVFDPTRPPFDDVRARRAVNFALDRGKLLGLGGGQSAGRPTCQVLPPNFPGYRPYCPYTLDPSRSGWSAPDLARARRLVKASGTTGATVDIWWSHEFNQRRGRYVEQVLRSLGYRARLRVLSETEGGYWEAIEAPGATWHLAGGGWFADYSAASTFMNLLECSSPRPFNLGRFCDRAIDAKIRQALRLQEQNPAAANASWAEIDRALVDKAPWVPLHTPYSRDFVSKRVGNYQHHPLWGALLSQLWVRE